MLLCVSEMRLGACDASGGSAGSADFFRWHLAAPQLAAAPGRKPAGGFPPLHTPLPPNAEGIVTSLDFKEVKENTRFCIATYALLLCASNRTALEICFQVLFRAVALTERQGWSWTKTPLVTRASQRLSAPHRNLRNFIKMRGSGSFPLFCFLMESPAHFMSRLLTEAFGRRCCTL